REEAFRYDPERHIRTALPLGESLELVYTNITALHHDSPIRIYKRTGDDSRSLELSYIDFKAGHLVTGTKHTSGIPITIPGGTCDVILASTEDGGADWYSQCQDSLRYLFHATSEL